MDKIKLGMINLTPTMSCNLKCKLCGVLVPHYKYCPTMKLTELSETLEATFSFVERVEKLQITGGEPLLYGNLLELLKLCFTYEKQFDKLWIITNNTIPISEDVLSFIESHHRRIIVHISDYGVFEDIMSANLAAIKKTACKYSYLKYFGEEQSFDGWVDQGDFVKHGRDKAALFDIFQNCSHYKKGGSWYIRHGQMHWCGRSIRGRELDLIPDRKEDYLNIFEGTQQERRERLKKLMSINYITACDYCNGDYGTDEKDKRHKAGEQLQLRGGK